MREPYCNVSIDLIYFTIVDKRIDNLLHLVILELYSRETGCLDERPQPFCRIMSVEATMNLGEKRRTKGNRTLPFNVFVYTGVELVNKVTVKFSILAHM